MLDREAANEVSLHSSRRKNTLLYVRKTIWQEVSSAHLNSAIGLVEALRIALAMNEGCIREGRRAKKRKAQLREGHAAHLDAAVELAEALGGALAVDEGRVALVHIRCQQVGAVRVCACDEHGGNAADVSRQPGSHQRAHKLAGWDQHLQSARLAQSMMFDTLLVVAAIFKHGCCWADIYLGGIKSPPRSIGYLCFKARQLA